MIPVWGSAKEALADCEDGNYVGAAVNAGLAASDLVIAKALVGGLAKGGLKLAGPHVWRSKPWEGAKGARNWMAEKGFAKPGQPMHHWWLEQNSRVPNIIKNQPPFVKGMKDHPQHGRIHGPYTVDGVRLPRFNAVERFVYGTPDWFKAANVSVPGHAGTAAGIAVDRQR